MKGPIMTKGRRAADSNLPPTPPLLPEAYFSGGCFLGAAVHGDDDERELDDSVISVQVIGYFIKCSSGGIVPS